MLMMMCVGRSFILIKYNSIFMWQLCGYVFHANIHNFVWSKLSMLDEHQTLQYDFPFYRFAYILTSQAIE